MSSGFSENCEKLGWTAMRADSVSSADLTSGSVGAAATDPMHHPEEADETPLAGLGETGSMYAPRCRRTLWSWTSHRCRCG